jgi:hypothetical protein
LGVKTKDGDNIAVQLGRQALHDELTCFAVLMGGAHHKFRLGNLSSDGQLYLAAKGVTLRYIRSYLEADTITDGLLFAIMSLALIPNTHIKPLQPSQRYAGGFDTPLKDVGGLSWLGFLRQAPEHLAAWTHLVRRRISQTGQDAIRPGIAEFLQVADLENASLGLTTPLMELTDSYRHVLDHVVPSFRLPLQDVESFNVDAHFKDILLDMRMVNRLIKSYSHNGKEAFDSGTSRFVQYRDLIQYRLLNLPTGAAEICRLTSLIYSYGVIYPICDPVPLQTLVRLLYYAMHNTQHTETEDPYFLLWAAVMGGIGATGGDLYCNFVAMVSTRMADLRILNWNHLVLILERFLWLDLVCGAAGKRLWEQAQDMVFATSPLLNTVGVILSI